MLSFFCHLKPHLRLKRNRAVFLWQLAFTIFQKYFFLVSKVSFDLSCQEHSLNFIWIFIKWVMQYFWLGLFLFFETIFMSWNLSAAIWDDCVWLEVVGWRGGCEEGYQLSLSQPVELQVKGAHRQGQKGAVICPFWTERAAYGAGGDRSICSSRMIFTPEWRRKMWSVNAVIWLCNPTDCSGSGKVTYLLGWHDWPMSADVWRQASFWSAAAQLCPWAVLVPVQKSGDFYMSI